MIVLRSPDATVGFSPLGAKLVSFVTDGVDVVRGSGASGSDDLYAGAMIGRHAGRVAGGQFPLDGKIVKLLTDQNGDQLHGGAGGFHARRWDYLRDGNRITFQLHSNDGDMGYPGDLAVTAAYELQGATLSLEILAHTTAPTLCNITNHAYWNLAGSGSVLDHELMVAGDTYYPLSAALLPQGTCVPVTGTAWDFRSARTIAQHYDGCIQLRGGRGEMKLGLTLRDPASGRKLEVRTSESGMQFYTAQHWGEGMFDSHGPLHVALALAIEPQNIADAPNHPHFPSSILRPGEIYRNRMEWRIS